MSARATAETAVALVDVVTARGLTLEQALNALATASIAIITANVPNQARARAIDVFGRMVRDGAQVKP